MRRWPTKRAQSPQATGSWGPVAASGDGSPMSPEQRDDRSGTISFAQASRIAGVSVSTLKRWADEGLVPVEDGKWTAASAAQARVIARMRERGYSFDAIREAARGGRLAFGYAEDLFEVPEGHHSKEEAAERTGLEPELIERLMTLLGTPMGAEGKLNDQDLRAMRHCAEVLASGFPLVAFLQLVRVYAQSIRKVADSEVRLFHLYIHEPLMQEEVPPLEIAEEMGELAADLLPVTGPLMEYMHNRYLRFYIEQDVVGHMEADIGGAGRGLARVSMAFCFVDLTGFTRYTEEEGDEEALDLIERFVDTVEATLPAEATIVKTIGDEVMVVSPEPATLTEWAVGFLALFQERPQPRVGIHYGAAVFRDGDYFGGDVNLAHRVVSRALGGEVLVTQGLVGAISESDFLRFDAIGEVVLKGFPEPISLYIARPAMED
jgi:adenylate cyclase